MSQKIKYNKLVRDYIPSIIKQSGKRSITHTANDYEYLGHLYKKVQEELSEFIETPCAEEMADLLEVLENISEHFNIKQEEITEQKNKKNKERGSFKERIILDEVIED